MAALRTDQRRAIVGYCAELSKWQRPELHGLGGGHRLVDGGARSPGSPRSSRGSMSHTSSRLSL